VRLASLYPYDNPVFPKQNLAIVHFPAPWRSTSRARVSILGQTLSRGYVDDERVDVLILAKRIGDN
jgi:hypothetical protein